jgi:hypothetical protein
MVNAVSNVQNSPHMSYRTKYHEKKNRLKSFSFKVSISYDMENYVPHQWSIEGFTHDLMTATEAQMYVCPLQNENLLNF